MKPIYLDHAAATPVDPGVLAAMQPFYTEQFFNPSALYRSAVDVHKQLEAARAEVAGILGVRPVEVTFTAGGTEANNLAIHGVMRQYPQSKIVVSAIEHDSVVAAAASYAHDLFPVTEQGVLDLEKVADVIDDQTVLISVMYANNEIGTIQPIRQLAGAVAEIRADRKTRGIELPLFLHTDAAQAGNYLDLHVARLGVDLMTLNGGKIYGPKQSGALFVRAGVRLEPLVHGGGQEHGLRSGTENVAGIIGFSKALALAQDYRPGETRRMQDLQQYFFARLKADLPSASINGWQKRRLPNNVHITLPGTDNERLLFGLDEKGVMAAAGSACSASSDEPSHVLAAIGLDEAAIRASLRFTMGRATTKEEIDRTIAVLHGLIV